MSACASPARYSYSVYGVRVTSDFPFEFPSDGGEDVSGVPMAHVEFVEGADRDFQPFVLPDESDDSSVVCQALAGGLTYLRWPHWYEFSIAADGSTVAYRSLDGCDPTVFKNFLFGQVLAVALVHQGLEPLHAAVVRLDDGAIGFLGNCTFGKSTLLATFLDAGHRVVTDDLLVLDRRAGRSVALPGSGRIKLLPDASEFLDYADGGMPLNPLTTKRSFHVDAARRQQSGVPLRQLFLLPNPDERDRTDSIEIRPASRVEMVRELLKNTFTDRILSRERLERQFAHAAEVAEEIDGFWLRYPTGLHHLPALRQAIVEHVQRAALQPTS